LEELRIKMLFLGVRNLVIEDNYEMC
jgi:hypothetical protein